MRKRNSNFKVIEKNIILKETNIVSFDNPVLTIKKLNAMFKKLYSKDLMSVFYTQPIIPHVKAKKEKKKTF